MHKTLLVIRHEIRISLRRKTFVTFAFGLPLLLGAVALALLLIRRDAPAETEPVQRGILPVHGYVDEAGLITHLPPEVPPDSLLPYADEAAAQSALVPDVKDARTASLVLMSPLIVPYILNMAIVERPDSALALLASLFPLTGPVAMIGRMAASAVPRWQALLSAALQLLTAALLLRLVARVFRAQQLLSGQPFTISRYFKLMLGRA